METLSFIVDSYDDSLTRAREHDVGFGDYRASGLLLYEISTRGVLVRKTQPAMRRSLLLRQQRR